MKRSMTMTQWGSRAVSRPIEAGSSSLCVGCGDPVKFKAKARASQVICNVYVEGRWDRVEHFHAECYEHAAAPYGEPAAFVPRRRTA
jgi:hypothetical protein